MEKQFVSPTEVEKLSYFVAELMTKSKHTRHRIFGIPRGGVPVALAVSSVVNTHTSHESCLVNTPEEATDFVDDLIDSGETRDKYAKEFPSTPFHVLIDKSNPGSPYFGQWIVFPWEGSLDGAQQDTVQDNIRRLLQYIGENSTREGLRDTPSRVVRAYDQWFSGYKQDPKELFKSFLDGSEKHQGDEMVILRNVPVYSHCEHHMTPFFGVAHVGYIPQGKILGLSKMIRVVDCFARRLQVQERLTAQIADALDHHLSNRGVGVIIEARHLCMESRGVEAVGAKTTTSAMRGNLLLNQATRQEFIALAQKGGEFMGGRGPLLYDVNTLLREFLEKKRDEEFGPLKRDIEREIQHSRPMVELVGEIGRHIARTQKSPADTMAFCLWYGMCLGILLEKDRLKKIN
jgi:GTP cyclohydrolase I